MKEPLGFQRWSVSVDKQLNFQDPLRKTYRNGIKNGNTSCAVAIVTRQTAVISSFSLRMINFCDLVEATKYFSSFRRTDAETSSPLPFPFLFHYCLLLRDYGFKKISFNWFAVILFSKKFRMYDYDIRIVTLKS
jgi:hypothetical protein